MRIVGGVARGRRLKRPSDDVRPTSDLVRGAIFDALATQVFDCSRVLDLYAGSGALGIEALSRGSDHCDFVERSARNASLIRENLTLLGMADQGVVHKMAVERAPGRLAGPYSLVLADPPYDDDSAPATLERIAESGLFTEDGTLVWEHSHHREVVDTIGPLALAWRRRYGDTEVSIYRRQDAGEGIDEVSG